MSIYSQMTFQSINGIAQLVLCSMVEGIKEKVVKYR